MIDFISWVAVVAVLLAYTQSAKRPAVFDTANVLLFIPVALPAILAGAYSSASISIAFGVIGGANLLRRRAK